MPFRRLTSDLTCKTKIKIRWLTRKMLKCHKKSRAAPGRVLDLEGGGEVVNAGHDQQTFPLDLRKA